jgi:cation:H+ antiporter
MNNLFILGASLFMVVKGATMATKYAARLAESFRLSKYVVGLIIIAVISILPETFVSINSALQGMSSFGLGVLLGSNVADLTFVFAVIILFAGRGIKIERKILKNRWVYPFILLLPLVLGINGYYSRMEGLALVLAGCIFYYLALKDSVNEAAGSVPNGKGGVKNSLMLLFSMAILLVGSNFAVSSASGLAGGIGINPVLIGMLVVGLGTTMPELFFSLKSVRRKDDSLAVGDVLGTVLADATIVVGILALIRPFYFPQKMIYVTGVFMVIASFILFYFMRSGRKITKKEAGLLFLYWIIFVLVEFAVNK